MSKRIQTALDWPDEIYRVLKAANVAHMSYVPDAGHACPMRGMRD